MVVGNKSHSGPRTLAAAAFKNRIFHLANSFRFREPRGAYCHAGWCQQCKVQLADGRVGLACQFEPEALSQLLLPTRVGRIFGLVASLLRPWFHERINLKFDALQALFLFIIRHASAALPLPASLPAEGQRWNRKSCTSVVVGGGESGRNAAALLSGTQDVLLVEMDPNKAQQAGGNVLVGTALGLYPDDKSPNGFHLLCISRDGSTLVSFEKLVVAAGGYERLPFMLKSVQPGIITATAFEMLAAQSALPAESKVAVFAPARDMEWIAGIAASAGSSIDCYLAEELSDHRSIADVRSGVHPVAAFGGNKLRGVELSDGSTIECDILVVGYLQPAYELQMQGGRSLKAGTHGEPLALQGGSNFPILAVGRAAGMRDQAGVKRAVEMWLSGATSDETRERPMPCPPRVDDGVIACPCEDVRVGDIRAACRDGFNSIEHVKRRTGAGTGPCQGKLCHGVLVHIAVEQGCAPALPTIRPLARPERIASFAGAIDE